jgi:hypothetical protein
MVGSSFAIFSRAKLLSGASDERAEEEGRVAGEYVEVVEVEVGAYGGEGELEVGEKEVGEVEEGE